MEPKEEEKIEVNEDAKIDKELADTLDSIKAGNDSQLIIEDKSKETQKDLKEETQEEIKEEPKIEETSKPQEKVEVKKEEYDYRIPNKGKFESDESYEKRIELMDLVKKRKLTKNKEQRQDISDKIKTTKSQLKSLNGSDKFINKLNKNVETPNADLEEDDVFRADRERLKELGGATKEDVQNIIKQEILSGEIKNTLDNFVKRHSELDDEDVREVFFDFVESNYNWQNKSGKDLMTILELAKESMFKPSESIQERVLNGANVQEKVNAMQFPGGTVAKQTLSPEIQKSVDELKATGMSEEKALELMSE